MSVCRRVSVAHACRWLVKQGDGQMKNTCCWHIYHYFSRTCAFSGHKVKNNDHVLWQTNHRPVICCMENKESLCVKIENPHLYNIAWLLSDSWNPSFLTGSYTKLFENIMLCWIIQTTVRTSDITSFIFPHKMQLNMLPTNIWLTKNKCVMKRWYKRMVKV